MWNELQLENDVKLYRMAEQTALGETLKRCCCIIIDSFTECPSIVSKSETTTISVIKLTMFSIDIPQMQHNSNGIIQCK